MIAAAGPGALANAASGRAVTHAHGSFRWGVPVPDPEKIICVGADFPDRTADRAA